MNIRAKLTLRFLFIVSLILLLSSLAIFGFSSDYRRDIFYTRLLEKGKNIARLLFEVNEIDIFLLKKIEKENPTSLPNERVTVYNEENEIIFTTDTANVLMASSSMLDSIRAVQEKRYISGKHEVVGFSLERDNSKYVILAGAIDIFGFKRLQNLRTILLVVNGVSIILVFISGWLFSGQALSPIKRVIKQVDEISINKLNLRVDEGNGTDEIALLAKTFNQMLERLEQAFKIQKNFIANASHELRTPLTAITGQLEVNLMKNRTEEEYKEALQSVLDDMKNLNSISNRLLLLAQTSSEIGKLNFAPVRIDEILWQTQSELMKHNEAYKIHIDLSNNLTDDSMLTTTGNAQLLITAFINLAENGCKYSPDNQVWINLQNDSSKKIRVQFIDKGIGIEKADLKQIFEPFYRGSNALSYKGHGIGLSLVERIINLHSGTIHVESSPSKKTIFTVSLPTLS